MFFANKMQLPWSTSNEDLVELFTTIGKVERAEIQYEQNGRSRGTGVVEFTSVDDAGTSISKHKPSDYFTAHADELHSQVPGLPVWWSSTRSQLRQIWYGNPDS